MDLKFYGPIYSCSGYARIRHLIFELSKFFNIKTIPFGIYDDIEYKDLNFLRGLEKNNISNPFISISVGIPLQFRIDTNAKYNIGYTMFEAMSVPKLWIEFCNKMDEIWVPSTFNLETFKVAGIRNVKLIPYGFDFDLFKRKPSKKNKFTFLSIGTFIDRKGWDILFEAYFEEFSSSEDVQLFVKLDGTNNYAEQEIKNIAKQFHDLPKIAICNKKVHDHLMPLFYNNADCFVLPTRGEAFGLPLLEALACGIPCITSDNGGYTDFLSSENTWFISSSPKQISQRVCKINTYYRDLMFNEPDKNHLKLLMRKAFSKDEDYNHKVNNTYDGIEKFSYQNIAKIVFERIKEIESQCV